MEQSLDQRFGQVLRKLREEAGKTQEGFGGIGRTYLSELERGLKTPTLETIVRLASELGVPPARMVEMSTSPVTPTAPTAGADSLSAILNAALTAASSQTPPPAPSFNESTPLSAVSLAATAGSVELPRFLAEAALTAFREAPGRSPRTKRTSLSFLLADKRPHSELVFAKDGGKAWRLDPAVAQKAVLEANQALELAHDVLGMNDIPFYELLGTRNLGSFVGAVFVYALQHEMPSQLRVNGHQDGYPDLCAMTKEGKAYVADIEQKKQQHDKKAWSKFPSGGIEVKTTCGDPGVIPGQKRKPQIGEPRTHLLKGATWKAHHRETNNLLGLFWDFVNGVPTVLALFYRCDLEENDWGKLMVPKGESDPDSVEVVEEGMGNELKVELTVQAEIEDAGKTKKKKGRTTSVSVMTDAGVKKMAKGWIVLPSDADFLTHLCKRVVFDLSLSDVKAQTSMLPDPIAVALTTLDADKQRQAEHQAATKQKKSALGKAKKDKKPAKKKKSKQ